MKIQKILSIISMFIVGIIVVPSVFSSNIGRNVYGILSETYNGTKYGMPATDADAVSMDVWNGFAVTERTDSPFPEGSKYNRFTINNTSWAGSGFACTNTAGYKDMSSYYDGYLKFYARSSNSAVASYQFGIKIGAGTEVWLNLSSYGFSANGSWHEITVPLNTTTNANLTSVNLANITQLFMLRNNTAPLTLGDSIDIDNIVWVKSTAGTFAAGLKKISNDVSVTTITWNNGSNVSTNAGWVASDQYIELDLDMYVTNTVWNVRIYTENGAINRNGLMSPSLNHKIPLCWRASDFKLPYSNGSDVRTLTIGEIAVSSVTAKLYDAGAVPNPNDADYWCWFWMIDKTENHTEDYNIVWDNRGFQGAENTGAFYGMNQTLGIFPRIYLGAKFLNVVGGQRYSATITAEFAYE